MKSRSHGAAVLALALCCAFPPFPCSAAECPPFDAGLESVWGLRAQDWDQACAEGRDLDAILRQVKADFAVDCAGRFPGLPKELVLQECPKGIPGRQRLQALLGDGRTAEKAGPEGRRLPLQSRQAAGLRKLGADGFDAGSLDRFYAGAPVLPVLPPEPGSRIQPAAVLSLPASPRVELGRFLVVDPKLSKDEAAFARAVIERMQGSGDGQAILAGLVMEGKAGKASFRVTFKNFPGTEIVRTGDLEDLQGAEYGEAYPEQRILVLNRALLRFRSRKAAVDNSVGTAAHEMTHLWRAARVRRTLPRYYEVFDMDLNDEVVARLKGQLVGAQTHRGAATVDTEDARDMLADPDDYRERMKMWSPVYAVSLDAAEMKDPGAAFRARLKALQANLDELKKAPREHSLVLKRIKHFCAAHHEEGLCGRLQELKARTEASLKTAPKDIAEAQDAIRQVEERLAHLKTKAGQKLSRLLRKAAEDPAYQKLCEEEGVDLARLRAEAAKKPLPEPKKTPGQIDREGLETLTAGDKAHAKELE